MALFMDNGVCIQTIVQELAMPKPMICLSAALCKYLELFRGHFSKRQWKYFVTVLLGLIECERRRTLWGLLHSVWEKVSLSGLGGLPPSCTPTLIVLYYGQRGALSPVGARTPAN